MSNPTVPPGEGHDGEEPEADPHSAATTPHAVPADTSSPVAQDGPAGAPVTDSSAGSPPASARSVTEVLADRLDNDGFFTALFDMTFTKFVTRKLAGPVYIVGLTLIALGFVLAFISSIGSAIATGSFWGVLLFLLDLLLSIVGSILAILLLRVGIEVFVAIVAIAENTRPGARRDRR
jgi:hypothetical protein